MTISLDTDSPARSSQAETLRGQPFALVEFLYAAEIRHGSVSERTIHALISDWKQWSAFCEANQINPLPASAQTVTAYFLDRIAAGRGRASLMRYLYTIASIHRKSGIPSDFDLVSTSETLTAFIDLRTSDRVVKKRALTRDEIQRILGSLDLSQPQDLRDAAIIYTAYDTLASRSQLATLTIDGLTFSEDGSASVTLLGRGKSRPARISPITVVLIRHWILVANLREGPLFRSSRNLHNAYERNQPLSEVTLARAFKRLARLIGIDADEISVHSARNGASQDRLGAMFRGVEIIEGCGGTAAYLVSRDSLDLNLGRRAFQLLQHDALQRPTVTNPSAI